MPIYEYQCKACGHNLEALQGMNDEPLLECPECHKHTLAKLVSASSFQLKGTGWYATDFKTKTPPAAKTDSDPAASKTETPKTTEATKQDSSKKDTATATPPSTKGAE
jgi:putative FmdB family regulatory protein